MKSKGSHDRQYSGSSGQLHTKTPFSSKGLVIHRKVPGPHIAFYVPAANWTAALAYRQPRDFPPVWLMTPSQTP